MTVDRETAARLMDAAGLDALVVAAPEAFRYVTGTKPGVPALFRRAGAALALLPADPSLSIVAIVTDFAAPGVRSAIADTRIHPSWVETAHLPAAASEPLTLAAISPDTDTRNRPATFDPTAAYRHLGEALSERGLRHGRIGLDLTFWPAADLAHLKRVLGDLALEDGSSILEALSAVKTAHQRAALDEAGLLAEAGVIAALKTIGEGTTRDDLAAAWQDGVTAAALQRGTKGLEGRWEYIAFGKDPWRPSGGLKRGDIVKFDVGTVVDGHSSDSARTFVFGPPSDLQQRVHDALRKGFDAGLAALTPGAPLSKVHAAATAAVRDAGLPWYSRGHFGHGVGVGVFGEIPPFIAADSPAIAEPGMVLAFETPLYVDGLGGFIIEDQVTITDTGATLLWSLSHDLVQLPLRG